MCGQGANTGGRAAPRLRRALTGVLDVFAIVKDDAADRSVAEDVPETPQPPEFPEGSKLRQPRSQPRRCRRASAPGRGRPRSRPWSRQWLRAVGSWPRTSSVPDQGFRRVEDMQRAWCLRGPGSRARPDTPQTRSGNSVGRPAPAKCFSPPIVPRALAFVKPGYLTRRRASGRSRISLTTNASRSASGVPRRPRRRSKSAWVGDARA